MIIYSMLKHLHVLFVVLGTVFFMIRFLMLILYPHKTPQKIWMILSHSVYLCIVISAMCLVYWTGKYPFLQWWATLKLLGLVGFIIFGILATKKVQTIQLRCFYGILWLFNTGALFYLGMFKF